MFFGLPVLSMVFKITNQQTLKSYFLSQKKKKKKTSNYYFLTKVGNMYLLPFVRKFKITNKQKILKCQNSFIFTLLKL